MNVQPGTGQPPTLGRSMPTAVISGQKGTIYVRTTSLYAEIACLSCFNACSQYSMRHVVLYIQCQANQAQSKT
jgi:hypothetical protein